jgi:uncharacterized glyoxalase superfamily protein PhnB
MARRGRSRERDLAVVGAVIPMRLTQQPYGDWEFEVRDPNGYVLVFGGAY